MARIDQTMSALMSAFLITVIKIYRFWLSPWLGNSCRFEPTCSRYAEQSIHEYGIFRGLKLTLTRLSKCHPWHAGGMDSVPTLKK